MGTKSNNHQNDHIILPNATLKRFTDGKNSLHYLDINYLYDRKIDMKYPRSFHTQMDFYDKKVDEGVKSIETEIGIWNKDLEKAVNDLCFTNINYDDMKKFAIKLITLQFQRQIMVDDYKRTKVLNNQLENLKRDIAYCQKNHLSDIKYVTKYNKLSKIIYKRASAIRYYQQNLLLGKNEKIENEYLNHKAIVLYILEKDFSFILPPSHFIGIDTMARIVLNPKIAIGLYPKEIRESISYCVNADDAYYMIPRSVESVFEMPEGYREIIGQKDYIEKIDKLLQCLLKMISTRQINNFNFIQIEKKEDLFIDDTVLHLLCVIINYQFSGYTNIVFDFNVFDSIPSISKISWFIVDKYNYKVAILSPEYIEINSDIKVINNIEISQLTLCFGV